MNTPENLKRALQVMGCDEEELLLMLSMRADKRAAEPVGLTFGDLYVALESAVEGENHHTPVIVRVWEPSGPDVPEPEHMDVKPYAWHVEQTEGGTGCQIVLDVTGI